MITRQVDDCILEIDVRLKSSNGTVFGAHQRNLEQYSDGFPFAASTTVEEVVKLSETADVLRLMLKFMHNVRQPELSGVQFSTLSALAEAVEKYMIYSAMGVCKMQMASVSLLFAFSWTGANASFTLIDWQQITIHLLCSFTLSSTTIQSWPTRLPYCQWVPRLGHSRRKRENLA